MKDFDVVKKIRELDERVAMLERAQPSASMDAGGSGARLYVGTEISERVHAALIAAGYLTNDDLRAASDEDLFSVPGVGPAMLAKIRAALG